MQKHLIERWQSPIMRKTVERIHNRLRPRTRLFAPWYRADEPLSPFEKVDGRWDLRGLPLPASCWMTRWVLEDIDLSGAVFHQVNIEKCVFRNVIFDQASLTECTDYANLFERCVFSRTKFKDCSFGHDGTAYRDCRFERASFVGLNGWTRPEFDRCDFISCKWTTANDLFGASFTECNFVGKLDNLMFRGQYPSKDNERNFGKARKNLMYHVDISQAILSDVTFIESDLSTVILSPDGRQKRYSMIRTRIERAAKCIESWPTAERIKGMEIVTAFLTVLKADTDMIFDTPCWISDYIGPEIYAKLLDAISQQDEP